MAIITWEELWNFIDLVGRAFYNFVHWLWSWTFGQFVVIFQSDWQALPAWKIILLVLAIITIFYLIGLVMKELGDALRIFAQGLREMMIALAVSLPYIIGAALIAFASGSIIRYVTL